jgi:hypothetical protein
MKRSEAIFKVELLRYTAFSRITLSVRKMACGDAIEQMILTQLRVRYGRIN